MLLILLAAGPGPRVVTQLAYRPAIFYIDSYKYLRGSGGYDPVGYNLLLKPILWAGNLATVAAVQHVLGLAMAVVLYRTLIRRHAPRWAAALATAPLLLDAYQLQMEQTIMPTSPLRPSSWVAWPSCCGIRGRGSGASRRARWCWDWRPTCGRSARC